MKDIQAICDMAQAMEVSDEELITNYYDFTIGEEVRILPLGVKRMAKLNPTQDDWANKREDEDMPKIDAIKFLNTEDAEMYISAAAVIVSTLKEAAEENSKQGHKKFFLVTCIGEKKTGKGTYQTFSIKTLM